MIREVQEVDLQILTPACLSEVLETMFFAELTPAEEPSATETASWNSAMLNFTGHPSGSFSLWVTQRASTILTAGFLGIEEDEVDSTNVSQTIAEMANMFCGSIVSRIESDQAFQLSPPRPAEGGPGAEALFFEVEGGLLAVTLRVLEERAA